MSTKKVPVNNNKPIVKYKVLCSKKYGRYLVAGKKLDAGEVIIREKPFVVGPEVFNDDHLCFECLKMIPTCATKGDSTISCSNCQVAVFCCVACESRKFHHTFEECEIFANKKILFNVKDILLPLRLWLIKKRDKKLWKKILRLEAHLEARRDTDVWKNRDENIIKKLKSLGIVEKSEENSFSELIHQICGIVDVNSFELPFLDGPDTSELHGLYLEASLIAHDCRGNTFWTFDDKFQLTIHASKPIDNGEMILLHYTSLLQGMAGRQQLLREKKYFECDCSMCEDPHELGTNLSTMFCPYCNDGLITLAKGKTKHPYVKENNWKCNKCGMSFSGYLIAFYLFLVRIRIRLDENSTTELEVLLKKLSSIFHPNHFLMLDLKTTLLSLYKDETEGPNQSNEKLKRMVEIGTDIVKVRDILEPGISCIKGGLHYNIHLVKFHLTEGDFLERKIALEEFLKTLEITVKHMKRSLTMLQYAPDSTSEGSLAQTALRDYETICQCKDIFTRLGINKNKK